VTIRFRNGMEVDLSIIDYWFNLIMWYLITISDMEIQPYHIFFDDVITRKSIKKYIDKYFIEANRLSIDNIVMNNMIDDCIFRLSHIDEFSFFLANTINLEDFIELMEESKEYYDIVHTDLRGVPIEKVTEINNNNLRRSIEIITNSNHCLSNFFKAGEGVNPKQYKEVAINIGPKPDGRGGIFPTIVNTNLLIGGVNDYVSNYIESTTGRVAQIVVEGNVGESGYFARLLGLNNIDTILHEDEHYICDTKNFQQVEVIDGKILSLLEGRYYRLSLAGMEFKIRSFDTHLIGKTILLRSPMTCSSLSRTGKICYRCYGDLAYTNKDINIGKMAAELISSRLTQRMLSAKHLLEACMILLNWVEDFTKLFEIEYNLIKLQDDINYNGYKIRIDPIDNEVDDDSGDDESSYNEEKTSSSDYMFYVNEFDLIKPNGEVSSIHTSEGDKIYLTYDFVEVMKKHGKDDGEKIEIDMNELVKADIYLFAVQLLNNDISRSLERIKAILDNSTVMKPYDRHGLLQILLDALIDGGIMVSSVHAEILLSNQIRSSENILQLPEWQYDNEPYTILSLKQALDKHPSVSVSLSFQKIKKALFNPLTFKKSKPSVMDLFYMEKPQTYLSNNIVEDTKPLLEKGKPVKLYKNINN
ncbi:MAG: hypothetical protein ACRCXT_20340, partial [Paraclostridium sp.]